MSLPWRFSVVGSWIWKKNSSTSRYEVCSGSNTISIASACPSWLPYVAFGTSPPVYPTRVETTPGCLRIRSCIPQKQPPASTVRSVLPDMDWSSSEAPGFQDRARRGAYEEGGRSLRPARPKACVRRGRSEDLLHRQRPLARHRRLAVLVAGRQVGVEQGQVVELVGEVGNFQPDRP